MGEDDGSVKNGGFFMCARVHECMCVCLSVNLSSNNKNT